MPEPQRINYAELLKYPVTVFSILLAVLIASWVLQLKFGSVAKVGTSGVEFTPPETGAQLADVEGKLNGVLKEIEVLKRSPAQGQASSLTSEQTAEINVATQSVSDATAEVTNLETITPPEKRGESKFIYIGNYDDTNGWYRAQLAAEISTLQAITTTPDELKAGQVFYVRGNMVVRAGLPPNDQDYFRTQPSLGTIKRGTKVRLVSTPVGIDRGSVVQYWAQIELP